MLPNQGLKPTVPPPAGPLLSPGVMATPENAAMADEDRGLYTIENKGGEKSTMPLFED